MSQLNEEPLPKREENNNAVAVDDDDIVVVDYTEAQLSTIVKMNIGAACFHFAQFLVMLMCAIVLEQFSEFRLPLTANYLTMQFIENSTANATKVGFLTVATKDVSTVYFGPMVALFFLLSMIAHIIVVLPCVRERFYFAGLQKGRNYFRWVEYSISSTLMIWLIAMLFGIYDISTLLLISICNATMNLLGLLMEQVNDIRNPTAPVNWFPFILGCFVGAGPWIACFQYLGTSRAEGSEIPDFVWGVLFGYIVMFNTFPINMILQYCRKIDYLTGEKAYIILSFVAKCVLCWFVFSGANQPNRYRDGKM